MATRVSWAADVYAWIWRKLPFGLPGKLVGVLALTLAAVALLWYVVFPWAEPILPFDDVQVTNDEGVPGGADVVGTEPADDALPSTEPDSPVPSTRPSR